ncbi:MAG: hypothetical protein NC320_10870 [Clostridium sp.]|nr:hypothetical protein [Clostridium sp.]MCM1548151.1 hypothetical protein [Ruminococcus sp.]
MPVIKCPYCGKKTIDSSDTCLMCGEKINNPSQKSSEEIQTKINQKLIVVPIVIAIILFGVFIIIQSFGTKNDDEPVFVSTADSDTDEPTAHITDAPTQATALTDDDIVRYDIDQKPHNFHLNYDVLWGLGMDNVEASMGTPDKYGDNYMVYKNILFDTYPADAVFSFKDDRLIWVSMKFYIDSRQTAVSYFEDIQDILINEFGEPRSETSHINLYDLTKKLHGYLLWEQPNSKIVLNLSNYYANFDDILTYSSADSSAIPSRSTLESMINDPPEQPTESPDKSSPEDIVSRNITLDADTDFSEYSDMSISGIVGAFGIPDKYSDNYVVYKNILFDIYSADAVFNLKDGKFDSAAIAFHDTESVTLSDFQYIRGLLADKYGDYEEYGNLHDFTKKLNGHITWKQSDSLITLSLSYVNTTCDIVLTYSSSYPYLPNRASLDSMINDPPEQSEPATEAVIRRNTDYNANVDYGEYWGCDTAAIESEFGTPDEYGEDSMIYKSILFGTYNSEVTFEFENDGLYSVVVSFGKIIGSETDTFNIGYNLRFESLKELLNSKFGTIDVSLSKRYPTWITPESQITLYSSRITYEKI